MWFLLYLFHFHLKAFMIFGYVFFYFIFIFMKALIRYKKKIKIWEALIAFEFLQMSWNLCKNPIPSW